MTEPGVPAPSLSLPAEHRLCATPARPQLLFLVRNSSQVTTRNSGSSCNQLTSLSRDNVNICHRPQTSPGFLALRKVVFRRFSVTCHKADCVSPPAVLVTGNDGGWARTPGLRAWSLTCVACQLSPQPASRVALHNIFMPAIQLPPGSRSVVLMSKHFDIVSFLIQVLLRDLGGNHGDRPRHSTRIVPRCSSYGCLFLLVRAVSPMVNLYKNGRSRRFNMQKV